MQERPLAQALVRIGRIGAQQQCGTVDAAAGQHVMPGLDRDSPARGGDATRVHRHALQASDLAVLDREFFGAGEVEQFATFFQGGGNGRHQHRLLGVGRAAHAAIAEVPATAHIARDDMPGVAKLFAALADHVVVGIRRNHPRRYAQALFHFFEPGRHLRRAMTFDLMFPGPVLECRVWRAKA
ncbi:hypothetical protein D3C86_1694130 [compost metagenome]